MRFYAVKADALSYSMENQPSSNMPPASTPAPAMPPVSDQKDIEDNKVLAAFSYLGILFIIPLLAARQSKFAMYHVKQGIIWFVVVIIVSFFMWIPLIGWLLGLATFATCIYGFFQAIQGKYWEMPVIAPYAKKINL